MRGSDSQAARIEIRPRIRCHDFVVLRAAALEELGITKLPENVVRSDLADGKLERVLTHWDTPWGSCTSFLKLVEDCCWQCAH